MLKLPNKFCDQNSHKKIVFIDQGINDYQLLADGINKEAEVIFLDSARDGVIQITETLQQYGRVAEVHIVSHGLPGKLKLGKTKLSFSNLNSYKQHLQNWSTFLYSSSLFLYGCQVAANRVGSDFIKQLHQLTHTNIAASANYTGSRVLGGDWNLEVTLGEIAQSQVFSSAVQSAYPWVLIDSDDFNSNELDSRWTFINPLNDGSFNLVGAGTGEAYLELFVPGGTTHNLWKTAKDAVRVMQPAANTDFELESKYLSEPSQRFQFQGILVEQDADNWLRFEISHNGKTMRVYAAITINGSSNGILSASVASGSASYLRVNRQGDLWTLEYSGDGFNWTTAGSFTQQLSVSSVGTFAGNAGGQPAFTAQVDYFFNTAAPIVPEDGGIFNQTPIANDDSGETDVNTATVIDVLNNDLDNDGSLEPSTLAIVSNPSNGTLEVDPLTGQVTYIPNLGFTGNDSFGYTVEDNEGATSNQAFVSVSVGSFNQAPVANDDSGETDVNTATVIDVLNNDLDNDGSLEPSTLAIVSNPSNGTLEVDPLTGQVTYTPNLGFIGNDSFGYTVEDNEGATSNEATVSISVNNNSGENNPTPIESDDFNSNELDSRWTFINPLNDGSFNLVGAGTGEAYLELFVPGGTTHNLWKTAKDAVRVMQPTANTDFELEVKYLSEPSQRFQFQGILVEQDADNWLRFEISHNGKTMRVYAAITINGSSNGILSASVASGSASYLRVNRQGDLWTLEYSGDGFNWTTAGSFTQQLSVSSVGTFAGNAGGQPAFTAQVDYFFNTAAPIVPEDGGIFNQTPIANDDSGETDVNTATVIDVLNNDLDNDGSLEPSTLAIVSNPSNGTLEVDPLTGQVTYIPNLGFTGNDSFGYTVEDNEGATSNQAFVSVSVGSFNQAPVANDDSGETDVNTATVIDVLNNDLDNDGSLEPSTLAIVSNPSNGTLEVDPLTGQVTYTPNTDFTGNDSFGYTVEDNEGATSNQAFVSVSVETSSSNQGDGPLIDVWYGLEQTFGQIGQPQTWINILGHVDDPDGVSSLTYSLNGGPELPLNITKKTRIIQSGDFNADIAYADLDGSSIDDFVTFTATDELGNVSTQTVTINYEDGNVWPENYSIDWSNTSEISEVAQVVDGLWTIEGDTVRIVEPGYDRLIAIGDVSWANYEVTVPITINNFVRNTGRVGLMMRWPGHNDDLSGKQPFAGFEPYGAIGWAAGGNLKIRGEGGGNSSNKTLEANITYNFKMRVETTQTESLYSLKAWELGQSEPLDWDVQRNEGLSDLQNGSLLLVAHKQDASFGNVTISLVDV